MMCAWEPLLKVLPVWLRQEVDKAGREDLQEIRLRIHAPPELVRGESPIWVDRLVQQEDLQFCINTATRYSPWASSGICQGYISIPGGHRMGLCGELVRKGEKNCLFREVNSLNIRVAKDYLGISGSDAASWGSVLVLGAPGWGKTTLLRDIARQIARQYTVAVVDERRELFPDGFDKGKRMDVLNGCPKAKGIHMLLRTMGPAYIALDEITEPEDTQALMQALGCGVKLLATAHGTGLQDLRTRAVYQPLLQHRVFQTIIRLRADKSWTLERMAA